MRRRCEQEVVELHQFFEDWFCGRVDDFARAEAALSEDFTLVSPRGTTTSRDALLDHIKSNHGGRAEQNFSIRIENFELRHVEFGLAVVTYEEWQTLDEREAGRVSSAVMRVDANAPCGVRWIHLQETFLER